MRMTTKANGENDAPSELAATIRLAVPVVLVQLGFTTMGLVDTLMVGRLSASVLAAVALGNLYFFNVSIFGVGTLMALDPLVSQAIGAGDHAGVSRAVQRGLIIAGMISVVTALCLAPASSVLRGLHQPPRSFQMLRRTRASRSPASFPISRSWSSDKVCRRCIAWRRSSGR
jgi:Na+-driven multidrug efflux pump